MLLEPGEGRCSLETLALHTRSSGLSTSLLAGLRVLSGFDGASRAVEAEGVIARGLSSDKSIAAKRLAAFFSLQLRRGVVSETVVGLTGMTPSLAWRFVVSRLRSLGGANYRRNKFAGTQASPAGQTARTFVHDLVTLTPGKFALYRAVARATREYAE